MIREINILEGDNLFQMDTLLKEYSGKFKLVYADPPYNTGDTKGEGTFTYNNLIVDYENWFKERIEKAHQLLRPDGFMVVSMDHNELFTTGRVLDSVFGSENRAGIVTVMHENSGRASKFFKPLCEWLIIYAKDYRKGKFSKHFLEEVHKNQEIKKDKKGWYHIKYYETTRHQHFNGTEKPSDFRYPVYVSADCKKIDTDKFEGYKYEIFPHKKFWNGSRTALMNKWLNKELWVEKVGRYGKFKDGEYVQQDIVRLKFKSRKTGMPTTLWTDPRYDTGEYGTKILNEIMGKKVFAFPKSVYLMSDILQLFTTDTDLVLDIFGGSGTTAHAIIERNYIDNTKRKLFIIEELPEHVAIIKKRIERVRESYERFNSTL